MALHAEGFGFDCFHSIADGNFWLTLPVVYRGKRVECFEAGGVYFQGACHAGFSLCVIAAVYQHLPFIYVAPEIAGAARDKFVEMGFGFFIIALLYMEDALLLINLRDVREGAYMVE